jgi:Asp-tRNA(Asn)/Glu-tRNA(Gln) amidotransferase A subunit family amidase
MIKNFLDKLLGKATGATAASLGKRVELGPQAHGINPALVDERAATVVRTLKEAGYEAYIVGGAVRDLLLGSSPRTSTSPPTPRPSRSRACSGAPSSSGGAFASCTWCSGAGASTR